MARLFISHAAKDEAIIEEFADLLQLGIGVQHDDFFCSSLPGMGIPTGRDFVTHIKTQIQNPALVIVVMSPAFLESQFCHNEVGATWALDLPVYPILVPPIGYGEVRGVLQGRQAAKLDSKEGLNDLRDHVIGALGLPPLPTSKWERKRDRFLERLRELTTPEMSKPTDARPAVRPSSGEIVLSSGQWVKLGDHFYEAETIDRPNHEKLLIHIVPASSEQVAALESLRSGFSRGACIGYAHENEGCLVQIGNVSSSSQGGRTMYVVEATMNDGGRTGWFMEMNIQGHSPDDIAEMRAGRLLVNDPPPPKKRRGGWHEDDFLENFVAGGSDAKVKTGECVVRSIFLQHREPPERGMRLARLEAVFRLKATGIVQDILEFSLRPISGGTLHVRFRGRRPRHASNVEPEVISIEGDCDLG